MKEVFAHEDEFSLAIFGVLGDGIESIGRLLIWIFQYDSYLSVSCRFGLLGYYWVPSSTRLVFLVVNCCELSLRSSLFSEVSRTSSLLDLPLPCGWET